MSLGLAIGIAPAIRDVRVRALVRVLGFVPPALAYALLKPPSFGSSVTIQLSTSQWIGLVTALLVSYFYAEFWTVARKQPGVAMNAESLGPGAVRAPATEEDTKEEEEGEVDEEHPELSESR
jgi:hypothetical protein